MSEQSDFNSRFELLSEVVKAGRTERHLLSPEKMGRVFEAYREAERASGGIEMKPISQESEDVRLSKEEIQKLTAPEVRALLENQETKSINGIERETLRSQFEETEKMADEKSASKAIKERLEREPELEERHSQHLETLRHREQDGKSQADARGTSREREPKQSR